MMTDLAKIPAGAKPAIYEPDMTRADVEDLLQRLYEFHDARADVHDDGTANTSLAFCHEINRALRWIGGRSSKPPFDELRAVVERRRQQWEAMGRRDVAVALDAVREDIDTFTSKATAAWPFVSLGDAVKGVVESLENSARSERVADVSAVLHDAYGKAFQRLAE